MSVDQDRWHQVVSEGHNEFMPSDYQTDANLSSMRMPK